MIRKMVLSDLEAVYKLEEKCFSVPWTYDAFKGELTSNLLARYLVILHENKIVGYGGVWYIVDEGHITNIAVDPDYRKKGLGQRLVAEMINQAIKNGIHQMTLEVRKSNIPAIHLYEKMGFEIAGVRPKYYTDNHEDALIMWLDLQKNIKE